MPQSEREQKPRTTRPPNPDGPNRNQKTPFGGSREPRRDFQAYNKLAKTKLKIGERGKRQTGKGDVHTTGKNRTTNTAAAAAGTSSIQSFSSTISNHHSAINDNDDATINSASDNGSDDNDDSDASGESADIYWYQGTPYSIEAEYWAEQGSCTNDFCAGSDTEGSTESWTFTKQGLYTNGFCAGSGTEGSTENWTFTEQGFYTNGFCASSGTEGSTENWSFTDQASCSGSGTAGNSGSRDSDVRCTWPYDPNPQAFCFGSGTEGNSGSGDSDVRRTWPYDPNPEASRKRPREEGEAIKEGSLHITRGSPTALATRTTIPRKMEQPLTGVEGSIQTSMATDTESFHLVGPVISRTTREGVSNPEGRGRLELRHVQPILGCIADGDRGCGGHLRHLNEGARQGVQVSRQGGGPEEGNCSIHVRTHADAVLRTEDPTEVRNGDCGGTVLLSRSTHRRCSSPREDGDRRSLRLIHQDLFSGDYLQEGQDDTHPTAVCAAPPVSMETFPGDFGFSGAESEIPLRCSSSGQNRDGPIRDAPEGDQTSHGQNLLNNEPQLQSPLNPPRRPAENGARWSVHCNPASPQQARLAGDPRPLSGLGAHKSNSSTESICPHRLRGVSLAVHGATDNRPFRIRPAPDWKLWMLHIKGVQLSDLEKILSRMTDAEQTEFKKFWFFFCPESLSRVPRGCSGLKGTRIDLSDNDIWLCLQAGLFEYYVGAAGSELFMHIFCVAEPEKRRRRFIIHTADVNAFYATVEMVFNFETIEDCIRSGAAGYSWQADAAAFYHQFLLPDESKKYYAFATIFGILTLRTIPTGQRHCVGLAQTVSYSLLRIVNDTLATDEAFQTTSHSVKKSTYIDNFRMSGLATKEDACKSVDIFLQVCADVGVTINESAEEIKATIGQSTDFRGIHFGRTPSTTTKDEFDVTVSLTEKSRRKLNNIRTTVMPEIHRWSMETAESVMSFFVHCSAICRLDLSPYYYVYKFNRRRQRQINAGFFERKAHARVWPSVYHLFELWLEDLLASKTRPATLVKFKIPVLVTDASRSGWGAMLFLDGKVTWVGAPWSPDHFPETAIIAELEGLAVKLGLEDLLPDGGFVHSVIDNTTFAGGLKKRRSKNFFINKVIGSLAPKYTVCSVTWIATDLNPADPISRGDGLGGPLWTLCRQATANRILAQQPHWQELL